MHPTAERLYQAARERAGLTMPAKVAIALGESQQTLKHWETRGVSQRGIVRACELWNLSAQWLRTGAGEMGPDAPVYVAHALSYTPFNLPLVTREQLVAGKEVEGKFILRLTDNALASYAGAGRDVIFDADLKPEPGDGVLIRDAAGQVHVRRMAPTKQPGRWQGVSDDPVIYPTLDSVDDRLTVLAVWFTVFEQRLSRA